MFIYVLQWLTVGLLVALVGGAELVSRYKDAPAGALRTSAAMLYIAINVAASLGAFALVNTFGWNFGVASSSGES